MANIAVIGALDTKGESEASTACMMLRPPRKVVLGTGGYLEHLCEWDGAERPDGYPRGEI